MSAPGHRLTWVIVSYGGVDDAVGLVRSLGTPPGLRILVAANKVGDADQAEAAFADDPRVTVVDYPDNPGYLPALARSLPDIDVTTPVVLSNCDLTADPGAVAALLAAANEYPHAGWLAPSVIGSLGVDQNPNLLHPPSARRLQILAAVHRFPVLTDLLLLRREGHSSRIVTGAAPGSTIWAGHGSCIVLTPPFFARGGRCDYPFALFGEELWLGEQCARLGLDVVYVPSVVLRHTEHAATGRRRRGHVAEVKYAGLRFWARRARELGW